MKKNNQLELMEFIKVATSPFHVVNECANILKTHDFLQLDISKNWVLENGKSYYCIPYDSSLFAFTLGDTITADDGFFIAAAHTDHPCLRVKPVAELSENNYLKVNSEIYGGAILNTWLDRPLSIAGKISLKSNDILHPLSKVIDIKKPVLTIPNLAIHVNKEINKGIELNKQKDMMPLTAMLNDELNKDNYFLEFLAKTISVKKEDILSFDLYIYNCEEPCVLGLNDDFISSPRLDNLTSVKSCLDGIISSNKKHGVKLAAFFDNEEIGSRTKQGADSTLMTIILEKIMNGLNKSHMEFYNAIMNGILLSVDVGHALHPNYPEKNDPVNTALLNNGVVLKIDSTQKYAYDTDALSIIMQLCNANNIPYQKFANRSDMPSGSTLGSIASAMLPMKTIDIGVPLLAMHSARELMGSKDQKSLDDLVSAFFNL